jgi:alkylated DNA repair protein (DNA oxidative demethylase)
VDRLWEDERIVVAPGAVLLPAALDHDTQRALVADCRAWAEPPAGLRATRMPDGSVMSARTVCLGWHWYPYRYSRTVDDGGGEPVKPFPPALGELARDLAARADPGGTWWDAAAYEPDVALVNLYEGGARMGLHQDRDERSPAPVVSISLGDAGAFRLGNTENRKRPWHDRTLRSGDVLVFGGPARLAYHGILRIQPGTSPPIGLPGGRLNITIRESGLAPS